MKEKRLKKRKVSDEWQAAKKEVISRAAKSNLLRQSVSPQQASVSAVQQGYMGSMFPPPPVMMQGAQFQYGGKGGGKGKGGVKGKGGGKAQRTIPLDAPQKSWCPALKGPFAPDHERYNCPQPCKHCLEAGVQNFHAGSWECDVQWWAPRARFMRGEVDRWNNRVQSPGMQGLQSLSQSVASGTPLAPPPGPPPPQP